MLAKADRSDMGIDSLLFVSICLTWTSVFRTSVFTSSWPVFHIFVFSYSRITSVVGAHGPRISKLNHNVFLKSAVYSHWVTDIRVPESPQRTDCWDQSLSVSLIEESIMSDDEMKMPNTQIEEVEGDGKSSFGANFKEHLRRFWWLHLIFFMCSTLILVLCL